MKYGKETIHEALRNAWGADTSYSPTLWTPDNPALGQCTASSLVVHRMFGGEIIYRATMFGGQRERHYFNMLPGSDEFDTTREQYPDDQAFTEVSNRLKGFATLADKLAHSPANYRRFNILNNRVLALLAPKAE